MKQPYCSIVLPALTVLAVSMMNGTACGQNGGGGATTVPAEPLLAGPSVAEASSRRSLVQRDFNGGLVRLEGRPENAAIELLTLTPEQKKPVADMLEARAAAVNALTFDHLDLFLTLQSARQAGTLAPGGDAQAQRDLMPKTRELRQLAGALIDPPLVEQVVVLLPKEQVAEYRRLVSEYVTALTADTAKDNGAMGGAEAGGNARVREPADGPARRYEFNQLMREMARSLSAVVDERREQTEQMFATVNATPEQKEAIQRVLREAGSANGGKPPSPEQRAATARKIMDLLTPEQRELLRKSRQPKT